MAMPEPVEKRVTRSQLPEADLSLHLNRSPLKDARLAQRNYLMHTPDPPDDPGSDDEILLSPNKSRHLNSRANSATKRSASPQPQDDSADQPDGRAFKRIKCDLDAKRAPDSDSENTDTNARSAAAPTATHSRNLSEPLLGSTRNSSKPRSPSKQTPASPKGKSRARSVPVFPVLDLSTITPWRRRARSRSPSKEPESPKFRITFTSLAPIPDESTVPPAPDPSLAPPEPIAVPLEAPEPSTIEPPALVESPSTPLASIKYQTVFATPMSPLTPLPETPRPLQIQPDTQEPFTRTIGWGADIAEARQIDGLPAPSTDASSLFPLITPVPPASLPDVAPSVEPATLVDDTQARSTAEPSRPATKGPTQSRLPRPSNIMGPPPIPVPSKPNESHKKTDVKTSKAMGPPPAPGSTSAAPKNAFSIMMSSSARGAAPPAKGKGKEKEKEKASKSIASSSKAQPKAPSLPSSSIASSSKVPPKAPAPSEKSKGKGKEKLKAEEQPKEKASVRAKMRPREKPKPLPLPILVRLPEESDGERTSTPTARSRPETPTVVATRITEALAHSDSREVPPAQVNLRFTSPLTELGSDRAEEDLVPVMNDDEAPPSPLTELGNDDEPLIDDDSIPPPASSSPPAEIEFNLPLPSAGPPVLGSAVTKDKLVDVEMPTATDLAVVRSASARTTPADVTMELKDGGVLLQDVFMSAPSLDVLADEPPAASSSKGRPKPRMAKPRAPAPLPAPADRVTRSTSLKRKETGDRSPAQKKMISFGVGSTALAGGNPAKKQKMDMEAGPSGLPSKIPVPSPSKMSFASPTKASAARASAAKSASKKPVSAAAAPSAGSASPSKNKVVRASSVFSVRPPPSFTRSFTGPNGNPSSLQTLATALEKLRMPPPERPNTSMGFSRDDTDISLGESTRSADDRSIGLGRPSGALQRASTVASIASGSSSMSSIDEPPKPSTSAAPSKPAMVQRPLSSFLGSKAAGPATAKLMVGTGSVMRGGLHAFGAGRGRAAPKVSRNPGLPSVIGSPVKGGGAGGDGDATLIEETEPEAPDTIERVTSPRAVTFDLSELDSSRKGKEKERLPDEWRKNASRRASMALQDLSKSVSLPLRPSTMGPPETPLDRVGMRSTSSSYPSSSSSSEPSGSAGTEGMRRSVRIAKSATDTSVEEVAVVETPGVQPLTVLKGCIVFVDIISENGEGVRSFITDMLKNLGARVLGSVGQTCTHIVYKNGLRSTYNKYKALPDPKPHVVGMEWVVKSAENRAQEDETPYLIDMDDMNTTAVKRRKSMMPRLLSGGMNDDEDGDVSFDGSSSSMVVDDDLGHLAPLERARLRKAATAGTV